MKQALKTSILVMMLLCLGVTALADDTTVTVSGTAQVNAPTDRAVVHLGIRTRAETPPEAQQENSLRTDAEERSQAAAVESVREDSELYAYMRQNKDAAAALRMVEQLHRLTTQGGEDAMIKPGAWEKRLSEIAGKML